jgi:hypothetical protein
LVISKTPCIVFEFILCFVKRIYEFFKLLGTPLLMLANMISIFPSN